MNYSVGNRVCFKEEMLNSFKVGAGAAQTLYKSHRFAMV